jgi:tetratricopeptide (TPR) repeat protein
MLTLSDLIDSGQFQRAEKLLKAEQPSGPLGVIHQAEVHTYFNRLEDAGQLLEGMELRDLNIEEAARFALARGEWFYWRYEYDPAQEHFQMAEHTYRLIDDEFGLAKALYNVGRLKRREADFEGAQKLLHQALVLMKDHQGEKKDYLKALIEFNLGVCTHQTGQLDAAADLYSSAMVTLNKLEHGKYYGVALTSYGTLLIRNGKYEESLSVLNEAIRIFQELPAGDSLSAALNNLALAFIRLGQFEAAERTMQEAGILYQQLGNIAGNSGFLETYAELYLESRALHKAEKYATQATEQADLSQNEFVKAEALITRGRIEIKRNDFYAAAKLLQDAVDISQKVKSKMLETAALLYLAECELPTAPVKAQQRLTQVRDMLEEYHDARIKQEFERISQRAKGERLKITPDNRLIIDGNFLPNWYAAKEAMETFLLKNALRQSEGNLTKAGKILGITKVHVHDKKKQYGL